MQDDTDPVGALHQQDEKWKRLISTHQTFLGPLDSNRSFQYTASLDADAQSAIVDLNDFVPAPNAVVTDIASPVQVGDARRAFRIATTTPDEGTPVELVELDWTHGALLLSVTQQAPVAITSLDALVAFAKQVDALYQASPFVTFP
ncbi:MAG: hypothetical protein ACR2PL_04095 [Dehalococcoidia bacterium]